MRIVSGVYRVLKISKKIINLLAGFSRRDNLREVEGESPRSMQWEKAKLEIISQSRKENCKDIFEFKL